MQFKISRNEAWRVLSAVSKSGGKDRTRKGQLEVEKQMKSGKKEGDRKEQWQRKGRERKKKNV